MVNQAIEIWDSVCQLCKFCQSLPKSKQPSSKSSFCVLAAIQDKFILLKLHFFAHIAASLKDVLTSYQQAKPMVPFLHDDLHQHLRDIVAKFIKPDILVRCKIPSNCEIDLNYPNNQLKKLDIGFGANKKISAKVMSDEITLVDCKKFPLDCITFLKTMASQLIEKSPLIFVVVRNARCLNPTVICLYPEIAKMHFQSVVENLVQLNRVTARDGDIMFTEFRHCMDHIVISKRELSVSFDKSKDQLDEFYFSKV